MFNYITYIKRVEVIKILSKMATKCMYTYKTKYKKVELKILFKNTKCILLQHKVTIKEYNQLKILKCMCKVYSKPLS